MPLYQQLKQQFNAGFPSNPKTNPETKVSAEQDTLRIVVGILGVLLPIVLWISLAIVSCYTKPLESISHYFYTRVSSVFVITMSLLAVFLIIYKGKRRRDFLLSLIAGIAALLAVFFPTTNLAPRCCHPDYLYSITYIDPEKIWETFHFASAGVFLGCLAIMSIWRFPAKDSSDEHPIKRDRVLYVVCGIIMLVAMLIIFLGSNGIIFDKRDFEYPNAGTFWLESVAVWAFGYSWLLKAGFFSKLKKTFF
ncbi:hypothetical protein [Runella sp.]|uniref:hypothetical protein n=1 Tax=Runella sp. TaxID=1960881 RepID=UPI00260C63D2|nr:hypothetical protein [Runella sp.]